MYEDKGVHVIGEDVVGPKPGFASVETVIHTRSKSLKVVGAAMRR